MASTKGIQLRTILNDNNDTNEAFIKYPNIIITSYIDQIINELQLIQSNKKTKIELYQLDLYIISYEIMFSYKMNPFSINKASYYIHNNIINTQSIKIIQF